MASVQTVQKRILSDRQQDYAPQDEIIFNITPSDVQVLAGKNSYLKLEFTITNTGNTAAKASLDFFGGGGYSLIDRMQCWCGGTLVENCEEVPALVGTANYYSETQGLRNTRNLFEGLNSGNDGTIPDDVTSQFYSMLPCDGNPHFEKVSLLLPLKFSGVMYGRVFPVAATQGLQIRLLLSSAAKALKADLCNGMVVQRDRTGRVPELQDLCYLSTQETNVAPFLAPATNPQVGQVSQQLPRMWQLASGGGTGGELTAGGNILLAQITQQTTGSGAATYTNVASTSPGITTNATWTVTADGTGLVTVLVVGTTVGGGYEVGSIVTIAQALLGGSSTDLIFQIAAVNLTPTSTLTSVNVMKTGVVGTYQGTIGGHGTPSFLHPNVLTANDTFVSLLGQSFYGVDDAGAVVDFTANSPAGISAVDATDPNFIKVSWAVASPTGDKFTPSTNCPCFGAILDPNVVAARGQTLSYKVENIQLVCESVTEQGYVAAMMNRVKSQGGLTLDIKTYNVLRQNLFKNQVVSQLLIPTTEYRAKALLQHQQIPYENLGFSYWQPVNDNLRQYQYMVKDKNTPNRKVVTSSEHDPASNFWNVVCDAERTKTLTSSGIAVRKETHPSARFVFGRSLASAGHSFNANRNQCRLTQDWGISMDTGGGVIQQVLPQFDKLMLTFVPHFRKVQVQSDNVVVSY